MKIDERKVPYVIDNYFKIECDINTTIKEAYEKGFRRALSKIHPDKEVFEKREAFSADAPEAHFEIDGIVAYCPDFLLEAEK